MCSWSGWVNLADGMLVFNTLACRPFFYTRGGFSRALHLPHATTSTSLSRERSACCVGQVQGTGKASSSIKKRPNGQVNTSFLRPSILPTEGTDPPPCPHSPNFITKRSQLHSPPRLLYATCVLEKGFAPCTLLHHRPTLRGALGHVSSTAFGVWVQIHQRPASEAAAGEKCWCSEVSPHVETHPLRGFLAQF